MKRTALYDSHLKYGGRLVDFAGWHMPVQYQKGILQEHLETRRSAGLFDVSHMGRFEITGRRALEFLRWVLTNDAAKLAVGRAQYTLLADEQGGAIDDAYLYRFLPEQWLLVVNAANTYKDWTYLRRKAEEMGGVQLKNVSEELAMIALQGPQSEVLLSSVMEGGRLPEPKRNALGAVQIAGCEVLAGRTGYTGEPVCFELFVPVKAAESVWCLLLEKGACPVGLGARDTLRLEASLPLYGHEYGRDLTGQEIPILACPAARFGVNFEDPERRFIGRSALEEQSKGLKKGICAFRVLGRGVIRAGAAVFQGIREVGRVTSGTVVPYWVPRAVSCPHHCGHGAGWEAHFSGQTAQRSIGLAMLEGPLGAGALIEIDLRGRRVEAEVVKRNLDNSIGPITFAVV